MLEQFRMQGRLEFLKDFTTNWRISSVISESAAEPTALLENEQQHKSIRLCNLSINFELT
jgi:hypothetical protein